MWVTVRIIYENFIRISSFIITATLQGIQYCLYLSSALTKRGLDSLGKFPKSHRGDKGRT